MAFSFIVYNEGMDQKPKKHCIPCEKKIGAFSGEEIKLRLLALPSWRNADNHHLAKTFNFKDFKDALAFVNEIGRIAEEEGHHPNIFLTWGRVEVELYTHSANGITENDFILAELIQSVSA